MAEFEGQARGMWPTSRSAVSVAGLAFVLVAGLAAGQTPLQRQGQAIASRHCARCHAIRNTGRSPLRKAPPFRDLSRRYPLENLAEALAEGIVTGHSAMPNFTFEPAEIDALLAYIAQLTSTGGPTGR
jgi:mono/diheme cytochrome c family protein